MKLAEMAAAMEMNEGYLSELENGQKRYNQDVIEKAAEIIGVPVGYITSRPPPPKGEALDYSDPMLAISVVEDLDPADRVHIGALIESYHKKH